MPQKLNLHIITAFRTVVEISLNIAGIFRLSPLFTSRKSRKKRIAFQAYSSHLAQLYQTIIEELQQESDQFEIHFIILPHPHFSFDSTRKMRAFVRTRLAIPDKNIHYFWETLWHKYDLQLFTDVYAKFPIRSCKKILLMHGPVITPRWIKRHIFRKTVANFDMVMVNGEFDYKMIQQNATGGAIDAKLYNIGFPFLDRLQKLPENKKAYLGNMFPTNNRMTVLFAPSWSGLTLLPNNGINYVRDTVSLLQSMNVNTVLKLHACSFNKVMAGGVDWKARLTEYEKFDNVMVDYDVDDLPPLKYSDILITDISSRAFNFMLLGKPVVFCFPSKELRDAWDAERIKLVKRGAHYASSTNHLKDVLHQIINNGVQTLTQEEISAACFSNYGGATKALVELIKKNIDNPPENPGSQIALNYKEKALTSKYRAFPSGLSEHFQKIGYRSRYFFPHNTYYLPRCGPDGYYLADKMLGAVKPDQLWEIILYVGEPVVSEFPRSLYFDDDIVWHQQQLGKNGQIATANLIQVGDSIYANDYLSDLVQRISRCQEYRSRVGNRFKGWHYLLINSIMAFAVENGQETVYSPTADFAIKHTDPARTVKRELFDRVYDNPIEKFFRAKKKGNWWKLDVAENLDIIILGQGINEIIPLKKTICVYHDIERGLGHNGIDNDLVNFANQKGPGYLKEMLAIENSLNIKTTYNVVGNFLNEVREDIESGGHCLAFHSFDHGSGRQLGKCRGVDYRLKGYRVPQSKLTRELSDNNLCLHNFEWLGCWMPADNLKVPYLENRIVKIPMQYDDWRMYSENIPYEEWEQQILAAISENDFVAIGLHDCYAQYWLPHYKRFLNKIKEMGHLKTINEVANEVFLANAK